jgi:hypothetical protein
MDGLRMPCRSGAWFVALLALACGQTSVKESVAGGAGAAGAPGSPGGGAGGATGASCETTPLATPRVAALYGDLVRTAEPNLATGVTFDVHELAIAGLWDAMQTQLFTVDFLSQDGTQFRNGAFVVRNCTVVVPSDNWGTAGVRFESGVMQGGALYYTYSFGSGILRSMVGKLALQNGALVATEVGGYSMQLLFVLAVGSGVVVEAGSYVGFNDWSSPVAFGTVSEDAAGLHVVDAADHEIPPTI